MNKARLLTVPLIAVLRLHWIAVCVVVGVLLLYTLAGFFLVPYIARQQIESYVTETLQRRVSIGEIRFNPFVLDTSISNFRLAEADDSPLVAFRHLYVNVQLASLWQRAVVLHEVQLSAPDINLIIDSGGAVNLAKLAPKSTEPEPAEEESTRVHIGTLAVREGRIGIEDYTAARPFKAAITPIRFTLNDFKTDAGFQNDYEFAGTTTAGEQLTWAGQFTVEPLGSHGRFSVQGLKVATIDSYIYDAIPYRLASGQATLNGSYQFALDPQFALDIALPTVKILDLSLAERSPEGTTPIRLPEVDVQDLSFSYGKREVGLKSVDVKGAQVDIALEADGSVSLTRVFAGKNPEATASPSPSASPTASDKGPEWRVHVDTIRVADATIAAEDRSVSPTVKFDLRPVQLTVNQWSTDPKATLLVDADATINRSGRLLAKGELNLTPVTARMAIDLKEFDLPVIQPYLSRTTDMTLHSGRFAVKGDVSYAATPESAQPVTFKGEMQASDLRTTDQLVNEDFLKWRDLAVTGIDFSLHPDRLSIDRVVARQPYARVVIAQDSTLNINKVLRSEPAVETREGAATPSSTKQGKPTSDAQQARFPVRIRTVQVIDGSANFADYSIEPSFAVGILQLNGAITGLSSDAASRAKVKLDGKVDKYAPVDITGEVNLFSAALYTDLGMNFRNMELTTFNPYSGKFAGYNISKGKLSTELRYKVENRKLDASHHIVLDNLEFGAKTDSKDAAPIPLKLAIALLKDRNGVIDVNLPVSGTLDDPKFKLGPIIWKAVLGLLTKIVTAPFAALGALFGGGDELAYVDFAPGTTALTPAETEKLTKLAKALVERPQLRLSIPLTVVTAQDSEALARAAFDAKVPPDESADPTDEKAQRKRIAQLEKVYKEVAQSAPVYPPETTTEKGPDLGAQRQFLESALLDRFKPDDAALTALARERARSVQDALLANTELNPERVFITAERTEGKSEAGTVRMEMKLE
ncbi:uncharacterized protein involved in outer membrane biogenesis [Povalibacter uvarum]|uniref:Uncharacterized protein involved in outer membrane biogenesis n=1 Tax=Povalibacter uvarum TaxID=732238 RepID=A0A841HQF6_9GAMM|nr:DUF748 domain-containing protein [Povalibacter uvarum]MBB6095106.1 uncharacterized protein involved in outer membrane biogenesis [Povalibacter uvarum]